MKNTSKPTSWVPWLKRGLGGGFVLVVVALLVVAWLPKPVPVDVAEASVGRLVVTIDEDGRSRVKDRYLVSAPVAAKLMRIELEPGDMVEAGAVLAELVPNEAPLLDPRARAQAEARVAAAEAARLQSRTAISRAEAAASFANQQWERQEQLRSSGAVARDAWEQAQLDQRRSAQELASARFAARVAAADLELAQVAVQQFQKGQAGESRIEVHSPVDAQVLRVFQESAGVVMPGTALVELGNPAAMELVVDVLTSDAVGISAGAPVTIRRWGGDGPLMGHVHRVDPSAFTRVSSLGVEEQRVNVVIDLDAPRKEWARLGDGYRVEAEIAVWQQDDVLRIPSSAVFRHGEGWAVFQAQDGVAELTEIELGRRNSRWVQVTDGLAVGAQVILHATDRVQSGVAVTIR